MSHVHLIMHTTSSQGYFQKLSLPSLIVTVLPKNVFIVMQIESVIFVFILNSSFLSSSFFHFKFYDQLFPYTIRPANVPEGAPVQWEIELLSFEMPKVIYKIP